MLTMHWTLDAGGRLVMTWEIRKASSRHVHTSRLPGTNADAPTKQVPIRRHFRRSQRRAA